MADFVEVQNLLSPEIKRRKELKELQDEYSSIAKEIVTVKIIDNLIYIFCSGPASLKLLYYFKDDKEIRCDYSVSLKSYYIIRFEENGGM